MGRPQPSAAPTQAAPAPDEADEAKLIEQPDAEVRQLGEHGPVAHVCCSRWHCMSGGALYRLRVAALDPRRLTRPLASTWCVMRAHASMLQAHPRSIHPHGQAGYVQASVMAAQVVMCQACAAPRSAEDLRHHPSQVPCHGCGGTEFYDASTGGLWQPADGPHRAKDAGGMAAQVVMCQACAAPRSAVAVPSALSCSPPACTRRAQRARASTGWGCWPDCA